MPRRWGPDPRTNKRRRRERPAVLASVLELPGKQLPEDGLPVSFVNGLAPRAMFSSKDVTISGDWRTLKRKYLDLEGKLKLLEVLRSEHKTKSLTRAARDMNIPESTLRKWRGNEGQMLRDLLELEEMLRGWDGESTLSMENRVREESACDLPPVSTSDMAREEAGVEAGWDPGSDVCSTTSEPPRLEKEADMGNKQLEDGACPLIMECTVEELSEVQLDCFNEAKKAYEDAVRKANRLLGLAAPAIAGLSLAAGASNGGSAESRRPSPPCSPPPPASPPASPPPPPSPPVQSIQPSVLPLVAVVQPPKPTLSLAEDRPSAITTLSSEIPPPGRISLRRDLAAAPATQLPVVSPPAKTTVVPLASRSATPAAVAPLTPRSAVALPRRTEPPAQPARNPRGGEMPVGALQTPRTGESAPGDGDHTSADQESREMQTQTYPALHVTVRTPFALTPANKINYSARRSQLDQRVKKVLLNTASQFTEWLIQTRLVRATQYCPVHPVTFSGQPRQLRLGMFTDSDKLAQSGGYVWVKNCCRPKFLSVHYGSLFDASRLSVPNTLPVQVLKLMYHWACQTPLHNVTQWLKVRPLLIDEVYGLLRAVCMLKTEETSTKLGGGGRVVQVGLVSLGTSGPDGLNKNVKVEVLGVKDESSGEIRMVGFEPRIKNRIRAVVSAVQDWVVAETSLLLDHSISPQPFRAHFQNVTNAPATSKDSNGNIMHYLRRNMPRMFQTSLVFLKPAQICQFIAEIAWREKYGRDPNTTFSNIITHLGTLTQQCEGPLIDMLKKVLISPSMDLKRKPRKQKLATRPDSQPEFPALPPPEPEPPVTVAGPSAAPPEKPAVNSATSSPAPATDQVSESGGSEPEVVITSSGGAPSRRKRGGATLTFGKSRRRRAPLPQPTLTDETRGCFFKLEGLTDIKLPDLSEMRCWECKLPLTHPKHITGVYACKRCRYSTSCEKIYPVHQRVFHSKGVAPVFSMSRPIALETPMFCRCGFSTDSGNRLALHLTHCERRTASTVPFEPEPEPSDPPAERQTPMEVDLESEPDQTVIEL